MKKRENTDVREKKTEKTLTLNGNDGSGKFIGTQKLVPKTEILPSAPNYWV